MDVDREQNERQELLGQGHAWVKVELLAKLPLCRVRPLLITGERVRKRRELIGPRLWLSLVTCEMSNVALQSYCTLGHTPQKLERIVHAMNSFEHFVYAVCFAFQDDIVQYRAGGFDSYVSYIRWSRATRIKPGARNPSTFCPCTSA